MHNCTIHFLSLAIEDLDEIWAYYASSEGATAERIVGDILGAIEGLQRFPYAYRLYRAKGELRDEFRAMPVGDYLVFYVVRDNVVEIRRVKHGKTNWKSEVE